MTTELLPKTYTPSKEAAAAMERAIKALIGKNLEAGMRQLFLNELMSDETLARAQELLDVRMRALVIEGNTLRLTNRRLAVHDIMITGLRAERDPDDASKLAVVPVIKELV